MVEYFVYLVYRAGFALVGLLPLRVAFRLGNLLGLCAWLVLGKYRRLGLHNVDIAFGDEKSASEKRRLVRRHFQRLGANVLSSLKLAAMPSAEVHALVKVDNAATLHRELRGGRPLVMILSHIGNWELQAQMFPVVLDYVRPSTIFQQLKNRYIDKHVRKLRERDGVECFDRNEGFHKPIEHLRAGGGVGILSDQHAGDQGLWVPFFGKLASTTSLPALLAKRTGAAVFGTAVYTDGPGRWRMRFTERIDEPNASIEAITAKANEIIERQIRVAPEDGFWLHNRWKTPRPNFLLERYKRGVFLPKDLPLGKLKRFRILIRSSNWLGDAVMSVPAARNLSCIGQGIEVKGKISGDEDLQIDGKVEGPVLLSGQKLTVGRTAQLSSEVTAREIVVYGKVTGNLRAQDRVEIKKDGEVIGDVTTARISVEDGAYFKGRIEIDRAKGSFTSSEHDSELASVGSAN